MEEKKEWKKKIPMWIKEGLFEEVTDDRGTRILGYVNCSDKVLDFIEQEIDRAREEGRKELLDSIIEGVTQLKDLVSMFNPMSPEIRAKQSGEIGAYNGLLEKLSKLTTK